MKTENLIKENSGIKFKITFDTEQLKEQLFDFGNHIAEQTIKNYLQKHDEKVYSRKEVAEKFGICETSLWRYTKMGLIESKRIGARVFYPESEIKRLMSQKGGEQ